MDDFDRLLELQLRRKLDVLVAAPVPVRRGRAVRASTGQGAELDIITVVLLGGVSIFGGVGTIVGTVVGAFIPTVLQKGFIINEIDPFWQEVLVGATILQPRAGEMLSELSLAVKARTPLAVLADLIHPFPAFSRILGYCLQELAKQAPR